MVSLVTMRVNYFFWLCAANDRAIVTVRNRAGWQNLLCLSRYALL
jgi:hypothetical protein